MLSYGVNSIWVDVFDSVGSRPPQSMSVRLICMEQSYELSQRQ